MPHKLSSKGLGISYASVAPGTPPRTDKEPSSDSTQQKLTPAKPHSHSPSAPRSNRRPTIIRDGGSQGGFTSFSALQPPGGSSSKPVFPRRADSKPPSQRNTHAQPTRESSVTSTSTTGSLLRKAKSAELPRRFGNPDLYSGGRYIPLSGADDQEDPGSFIGAAVMSQSSSQSSGATMDEIKSVEVDVQYMQSRPESLISHSSQSSGSSHNEKFRVPSRRPLPMEPTQSGGEQPRRVTGPRRKRRSTITQESYAETTRHGRLPLAPLRTETTSSDPTEHIPHPDSMARSLSASTTDLPPARPLFSYPEGLHDPPEAIRPSLVTQKRQSNISTGIHSKNAVILSAESGGMMLEYAEGGMWKQGQHIYGQGKDLVKTPDAVSEISTMDNVPDPILSQRDSRIRAMSRLSPADQPPPAGRPRHGRSQSENDATLARHGTLLHPSSSRDRASNELSVMLGKKNRRTSQKTLLPAPENLLPDEHVDVKLEASKKKKARVEVDVVLERDCVVEGGEIRGRMEVKVNGSKKAEGLRVGGGKIRVVGFEEISSSYRHIFYHYPHQLQQFAAGPQDKPSGLSLFASEPDAEGFRLAAEGCHSIPFRMRLPLNGGAKGSFAPSSSKGPSVRYVVVGSVKLYLPSTGKRSIAHFYRGISVLPYLKASSILSPSHEPIEARTENGLGWSTSGEKGRVNLRVALGRRTWVCGQKLWCEVGIHNESSKRIKNLQLALLQTVQTFNPNPMLDPSGRGRPQISKRKSLDREALLLADGNSATDLDACQTSTQRRKVSEEVLESDFASSGTGRVTGKGWWTGVEPGDSGHWDLSLSLPPGLLSIRRTRLIEVQYTLRVTVNGSIYVDVPVTLIDFLSIDPPPMPGDTVRLAPPQVITQNSKVAMPRDNSLGLALSQQGAFYPLKDPSVKEPSISEGSETTHGGDSPARESSHTLHLDEMVECQQSGPSSRVRERPLSMASTYDEEATPILAPTGDAPKRPSNNRLTSYLSSPGMQSNETALESSQDHASEENDKALLAARRAQGRARSLAALERAEARAAAENEEAIAAERRGSSTDENVYQPLDTPSEEVMRLVEDSGTASLDHDREASTTAGLSVEDEVDDGPGLRDLDQKAVDLDVGNETLDDMVMGRSAADDEDDDWVDESDDEEEAVKPSQRTKATPHPNSSATLSPPESLDPLEPDHPIHQAISIGTANPAVDPQLAYMTGQMQHTRDRYMQDNRSFNGSVATVNTNTTDDSEIGLVLQAQKQLFDPPSQATIVRSPPPRAATLADGSLSPKTEETVALPAGQAAHDSGLERAKTSSSSRRVPGGPSTQSPAGLARSGTSKSRHSARETLTDREPSATTGDDIPELTPSVGSDTGSSEDHATLESPTLLQIRPTASQRTLPQIPVQSTGLMSDFAGMDSAPAQDLWLPAGSLLRNQVARLQGDVPSTSFPDQLSPPASSLGHTQPSEHDHEGSSNSHETGSTGHTHQSLLPSVKSKIAQLEERQEALRKMSLASFGDPAASPRPGEPVASPSRASPFRSKTPGPAMHASPRASPAPRPTRAQTLSSKREAGRASPAPAKSDLAPPAVDPVRHRDVSGTPRLPYRSGSESSLEPEVYQVNSQLGHDDPDETDGAQVSPASPASPSSPTSHVSRVTSPRSPPAKSKRKSYTTALAPRPVRTISDDTGFRNDAPRSVAAQRIVVSPTTGNPKVMTSASDIGHGTVSTSPISPTSPPQRRNTMAPGSQSGSSLAHARTLPSNHQGHSGIPRPKSSFSALERDKSTSSTSTSATTVEAALVHRNQQVPMRRPNRAQTMYVEGKFGGHSLEQEYQPYDSGPSYGSPTDPSVAPTSALKGDSKYYGAYGGAGGYLYGGGYGGYHDPYKVSEPGAPDFVRPADRPGVASDAESTHWENFY